MATSVIIGYYGHKASWEPLVDRAVVSVQNQTQPCQLIVSYEETLQQARNFGAEKAHGEQLVFLDADDELDPRYVEALNRVEGDVKQPSTLGVVNGVEDDEPVLIPEKNLITGNYIVIGAGLNRNLFFTVGGFRDLPVAEDWDLFVRCWLAGGRVVKCPEAIYRVHVNPHGRNRQDDQYETIKRIQRLYMPVAQEKGLV